MLAKVAVFVYQLRDLFLQSIVFLHQEFVHGCELPVHTLKPRGLFPLLLSASAFLQEN